MSYTVWVDDNYHYMDEDERYKLGEFETLQTATEACKKIVDEYLASAYAPGMSAAQMPLIQPSRQTRRTMYRCARVKESPPMMRRMSHVCIWVKGSRLWANRW